MATVEQLEPLVFAALGNKGEGGGVPSSLTNQVRKNTEDIGEINTALESIGEVLDTKVNSSELSSVATTGSYNDLTDRPIIPSEYDDTVLAGRVTALETAAGGHTLGTNVPADAVFTDTVYDDTVLSGRVTTLENAGYATETDIETAIAGKADTSSLATVATSGSYNDLDDKPTIPEAYDDTALSGRVTTLENAGYVTETDIETAIAGKADSADLATVATSGSYNDLDDKPTIPAAYDDTALAGRVSATENAINTLNGSGTGSVSKTVSDAIDAVVDGAPATFDTFKEIADWIQDDQTGAAAMAADLANKVNKVSGKGLSTEDYTTAEKQKLAGLSNYDDTALSGRVTTLENAGYVTEADIDTAIAGKADSADLATVATTGSYNDLDDKPTIPEAYDDTALSGRVTTLENAGYVTETDIDTAIAGKADSADLATVATSGSYNDLDDKPTIPAAYDDTALSGRVTTLENAGYVTETDIDTAIAGKADASSLATVATSGSYNDLTDKPTIPTIPTLATVATTGSYNDLENKPTIPAAYDDTALSGRVTTLENAGYQTASDVSTAIADKVDASDLAAVATSGSYNDLTDKPAVASGGAIPAYIVGETMTKGWLSTTAGGSAFTPVDKQEYIILSSGDWLRKHVIWLADLGVYRLTGKVSVLSDKVRDVPTDESVHTTRTVSGTNITIYTTETTPKDALAITNILPGDTITVSFKYALADSYHSDRYIKIGAPNNWSDTLTTGSSDTVNEANMTSYSKTFTATQDMVDNGFYVRGYRPASHSGSASVLVVRSATATVKSNTIYNDYETDDVIEITEAEVERLWEETGGMPNPNNNVFSTEERLWGYWIDGKPIYRKTIETTMPSAINSEKNVDVGATIETVTNFEAVITLEDAVNNGISMTLTGTTDAFTGFGKVKVYNNAATSRNKIGLLTSASGWLNAKVVVTLYYTKSA